MSQAVSLQSARRPQLKLRRETNRRRVGRRDRTVRAPTSPTPDRGRRPSHSKFEHRVYLAQHRVLPFENSDSPLVEGSCDHHDVSTQSSAVMKEVFLCVSLPAPRFTRTVIRSFRTLFSCAVLINHGIRDRCAGSAAPGHGRPVTGPLLLLIRR